MTQWIQEPAPSILDDDKKRLLGAVPAGSVTIPEAGPLPGNWWRLEENGEAIGYGWMDVTWGDAQIMVAVDPAHERAGHGAVILDHLADEAHKRGLAYLFNVIPAAHPNPGGVRSFLERNGFVASGLDKKLLRRRIRR